MTPLSALRRPTITLGLVTTVPRCRTHRIQNTFNTYTDLLPSYTFLHPSYSLAP